MTDTPAKTKQQFAEEIEKAYSLLLIQVATANGHRIKGVNNYGYLVSHIRRSTKEYRDEDIDYLEQVLDHILDRNRYLRNLIHAHMVAEHADYAALAGGAVTNDG